MSKVAIVCNGCEPSNLFPAFIFGAASAAMGDEVLLFFTPGAAPALIDGALERVQAKGMPEMAELVSSVQEMGGRLILCELAIEARDLQPAGLRPGVELLGVCAFLSATREAARTYCF